MKEKKLASRLPSPAMIVATAALFVALGGAAYATTNLPANSVGTGQLKNRAVTAGKIKNGAVTKAKLNLAGVIVPNARRAGTAGSATSAGTAAHAGTANHASTADIATNAATAGDAGKLGGSSPSAYLRYGATLPSGATETGLWGYRNNALVAYAAVGAGAAAAGAGGGPFVSFVTPLAAPLDAAHAIYVPGASAAHCPGVGQADPGYLCVYQQDILNAVTPDSTNIFNVEAGGPAGSGAQGFSIFLMAAGAGDWLVGGSYAVTAP